MNNSKTIWIINQDATTPEIGYAGRSYYLAEELGKLGYKVSLIAGGFSHLHFDPPKMNNEFEISRQSTFDFIWLKLPSYSNAHSKKRILNWFQFAFKISKLGDKLRDKPDIIIYSSPPLIGFLGAWRLKNKFKSKLIFELRDIWPMTLKDMGGYNWYNPLILLMSFVEKLAYRKSDLITSNLSNVFEYLEKYKITKSKYLWIPNGISENEVNKGIPLSKISDDLIPKDKFIIGYLGTLGLANALEFFLEASLLLKNHPNIYFVIVGAGREKEKLKEIVKNSDNVLFLDPVPKEQVHSLLSRIDVCYLGWRDHRLYDFGIGSNKLPEYMFSKTPILHSYSGKRDLVKLAQAGISVKSESSQEIADAIISFSKMDKLEIKKFGENGYNYVIKNMNYRVLASQLSKFLEF